MRNAVFCLHMALVLSGCPCILVQRTAFGQTPAAPAVTAATNTPTPRNPDTSPAKPAKSTPTTTPVTFQWTVQRRAGISHRYDENVIPRKTRRDETVEDQVTTLVPGLNVTGRRGTTVLKASYLGTFAEYQDVRERDAYTHDTRFSVDGKPLSALQAGLRHRAFYIQDIGGEESDVIGQPTTYWLNQTGSEWMYALSRRWSVGVEGAFEDTEYESPNTRDLESWELTPKMRFVLSATDTITLAVTRKEYHVEKQDTVLSEEMSVSLAHRFSQDLTGIFRLGATHYPREDETTTSANVQLVQRLGRSAVTLSYGRSDQFTRSPPDVVIRDLVQLSLDVPFGERWRLRTGGQYLRDVSVEGDRTDTRGWRTRMAVSRALTRWLTSELEYQYIDQEARGQSGNSLTGNVVELSLVALW